MQEKVLRYIEGLENQLLTLEEAYDSFKSNKDYDGTQILYACANCFELEENCMCREHVLWPVKYVIIKIKSVIQHQKQRAV